MPVLEKVWLEKNNEKEIQNLNLFLWSHVEGYSRASSELRSVRLETALAESSRVQLNGTNLCLLALNITIERYKQQDGYRFR